MVSRNELIKKLRSLSSGEEFIEFSKKTIKTKLKIIGVKVPALRALSKSLGEVEFIDSPEFYEEVLVEGLLIAKIKEREKLIDRLNEFYKKMDNWAVVDLVASSIRFKEIELSYVLSLLTSSEEFIVRFGIVSIIKSFIDMKYFGRVIDALSGANCEKYYISMAIAWLFSEWIIENPQNADKIMQKIVKNGHFNSLTIKKTIQKVADSYRVSDELKVRLREKYGK